MNLYINIQNEAIDLGFFQVADIDSAIEFFMSMYPWTWNDFESQGATLEDFWTK